MHGSSAPSIIPLLSSAHILVVPVVPVGPSHRQTPANSRFYDPFIRFTSPTMADAFDDDYIASILKAEAKSTSSAYSQRGLNAFLPQRYNLPLYLSGQSYIS